MKTQQRLLAGSLLATLPFSTAWAQTPCTNAPLLQDFGAGSLGSLGIPRLENQGAPLVGLPFALAVERGLPGAPGLVILSAGETQLPLAGFGATVYVDLTAANLQQVFQTDSSGSADSLIVIPALPSSVCGAQFSAQALVVDPAAAGGLAFTGGLRIRIAPPASGLGFPGEHRLPALIASQIAAGDLNGDGLDDLLVMRPFGQPAEVYLCQGDFEFSPGATLALPKAIGLPKLEDLDGDSDLDLYFPALDTASPAAANVVVLLGDGTGGFGPQQAYPAGMPSIFANVSVAVDAEDFDQDGFLDLVASSVTVGEVSIFPGLGGGQFGPRVPIPMGNSVLGVAAADMNSDGFADLVASGTNPAPALFLALNDGIGGFGAPMVTPTSLFANGAPQLADLNGDGKTDCVLSTGANANLTVRLGDGAGGFLSAGTYFLGQSSDLLQLADLDGDGDVDILASAFGNLASHQLLLLYGIGDGSFLQSQQVPIGAEPKTVTVGRFGPDPRLDVIATFGIGNTPPLCFPGSSDGTLAAPAIASTQPNTVTTATGDFDQDGTLDLASVYAPLGSTSPLLLWITPSSQGGTGSPVFAGPVNGQFGFPTESVVADFNADGLQDFLFTQGNLIVTLLANGPTSFQAPLVQSVSGSSNTVEAFARDLDGDGLPDLIVSRTANLIVLRGLGTGAFQEIQVLAAPGTNAVDLADLNGDGWLDSLETSESLDEVRIRNGLPGGLLNANFVALSRQNPYDIHAVDLDSDGDLDVAVASFPAAGGQVEVLANSGSGALQSWQTIPIGDSPDHLASADFDADGDADLALSTLGKFELGIPSGIVVLRNDGAGQLAFSSSLTTSYGVQWLEAVDLSGDGLSDLLVGRPGAEGMWRLDNLLLE